MKYFKYFIVSAILLQTAFVAMPASVAATKKIKRKIPVKQNIPVPIKKQKDVLVPLKETERRPVPLYPAQAKTQSEEKIGLSVGIKASGVGGLSGAIGDVSYSLARIIPGTVIRGSVGYLTGQNSTNTDNIKMTTVNLDAIYSVGVSGTSDNPITLYVGGGFIYPFKVNENRGNGAWGAHAYFGSKYLLQDSTSIYGELGYTGIKYQADEAAVKGVEALLGYSYSF